MRDEPKLEGDDSVIKVPDNEDPGTDWLKLAKTMYDTSTDYLNVNFRKQFAKNLANFQSKHPEGSKYHTSAYNNRSRLFRPKTRIAVRKNEAALAAALFSSTDSVSVLAEDSDDPQKRTDAAYWHEVLNYRLDKTIPWFKLAVGAFQKASINGFIISKQVWEYEEYVSGESPMPNPADSSKPMIDDSTGKPIMRPEMSVLKDRPVIKLLEAENFRFDSACDWTDPINSSPYLIECIPMYVIDIRDKMDSIDPNTGEPEWKPYSDAEIIASGTLEIGEKKKDGKEGEESGATTELEVNDYKIVWVCEIIVKRGGEDLIYYTLGTKRLLTEPEPIKDVYKLGHRPFVFGTTIIEAHKAIPASAIQLGESLQAEANDVTNQRRDNVKLILNSRKIALRDANTDLAALQRSVPGGVVLTDDIDSVKPEMTPDVTSSSYADQDRIDNDLDDINGVFNAGSVANSRSLGETVGGIEKVSESADKDTEYILRTFVETWVEPVLKQLIDLEQGYEDDDHIKKIATKGLQKSEEKRTAKMPPPQTGAAPPPGGPPEQAPQEPQAPQEMKLHEPSKEPQNIDVRVNVGFGNLNPDQRVKRIMSGLKIMAEIAPWLMAGLDTEMVADQIFSAMGHKNGGSFFTSFERPEPQGDPGAELAAKELQIKEAKMQSDAQLDGARIQLDAQVKEQTLVMQYELGMAKIASDEGITMQKLYTDLGIAREKIDVDWAKIDVDREIKGAINMTRLADVENKAEELQFKKTSGRDGI